MSGGAWNPWRELRARTHLRFALDKVPEATGGAVYARRPSGAGAIVIDRSLNRRERNAALAHELVHDEHGGGCPTDGMPDMWLPVAHRHETRVRREVARRLVPLDDLQALREVHALNELPPFTVVDVAEIFDCTEDVALEAMLLLI